jgi:hypothetical protein
VLFAAVLTVLRRNRAETRVVPIAQPPLWWLLVDEVKYAARRVWEAAARR